MALSDHKITNAGIAANGVQSQPDKLTGTAEENKLVFDKLITEVVKNCLNGLIDAIMGAGGAAGVGIDTVPGLTGVSDVQAALEKIELQLQDVTQGAVADGSITTAKLANIAVTTEKLANLSVQAVKLGNNAVITDKIMNGSVTAQKLADGAVETAKIPDGNVTTAKLADGCVTNAKIGAGAVGSTELDSLAVITQKLAALCVTAAKLANDAVETDKLKNGAVTLPKLGSDVTPAALGAIPASQKGAYSGVASLNDTGKVTPSQTAARVFNVSGSITLGEQHAGSFLLINSPSAVTITIDQDSDELTFPNGTEIEIYRHNVGAVTVVPNGVTLYSANNLRSIAAQRECVCLKKLWSNGWVLAGALG